jgi:hypothetical protein
MPFCSTCHEYAFDFHRCPTEWEVWESGERADAIRLRATNAEAAAVRWADQADIRGRILDGATPEVCVAPFPPVPESDPEYFIVSGEMVPEYTAKPVVPPAERAP